MNAKRVDYEPTTRVGICCGEACQRNERQKGWIYQALYKIHGVYRYRCAHCYRFETGQTPPIP